MPVSKARKAEIDARRDRAVAMRAAGQPWGVLVAELGYNSRQAAFADVQYALNERATSLAHTVDDYRQQQIESLERLKRKLLGVLDRAHVHISNGQVVRDTPMDENGDPLIDQETGHVIAGEVIEDDGPTVQAATALMKLEQQLARLMGTEAPTKVEQTGIVRYEIVGVDMEKLK